MDDIEESLEQGGRSLGTPERDTHMDSFVITAILNGEQRWRDEDRRQRQIRAECGPDLRLLTARFHRLLRFMSGERAAATMRTSAPRDETTVARPAMTGIGESM